MVIPRFTRTYGPTMLMSDTKAVSQFIIKAAKGENIILKSEGNQYYSYTYVADAAAGLFTVMLCGQCGEAYNIADVKSDILLRIWRKQRRKLAVRRFCLTFREPLKKQATVRRQRQDLTEAS